MSETVENLAKDFYNPFYINFNNPVDVTKTFTLKELCTMFNWTDAYIFDIARKKHIIDKRAHKNNEWTYSEYIKLKAWYDEVEEAKRYKDYATIKDVASELGILTAYVNQIIVSQKLDAPKVYSKHGYRYALPPETVEKIRQYVKNYQAKKVIDKNKKAVVQSSRIEPAELHPLVTDKRCLDFNYWPDTTPMCGLGEE